MRTVVAILVIHAACSVIIFSTLGAVCGRLARLEDSVGRTRAAVDRIAQPIGLEPGVLAPDFALPDTEGSNVALSDYSGTRVLIMFSDTRCMFCQSILPAVSAFSLSNPSIQTLIISRGTADEQKTVIAGHGANARVLAWYDAAAMAYNIPGTPYFYAVNEHREVIAHGFADSTEALVSMFES